MDGESRSVKIENLMPREHDYLKELHDKQYPWAHRFAADCVEHVLPIVERKWPFLAPDLSAAVDFARNADGAKCDDALEKLVYCPKQNGD